MADYGRYQDDQTRERERSRYGREERDNRGNRGSSMFGSGWGDDDGRRDGRRERGSWGGDRDRERTNVRYRSYDDDRERSSWGYDDEPSRLGRGRDYDRDRARGDYDRRDRFGYDDRHEGLPIDETSRLIASNKVEGTSVYGRDGERLGSIYNFMVDKRSGKVEYAVMSYGGFLGMGTRYYPMPWGILEYDTRWGGYKVDMIERDLERAPSFDRDTEPKFDRRYGEQVHGWYGLRY